MARRMRHTLVTRSPMLAVRPVSMAVKPSTDAADAGASQRASVAADYAKVANNAAGCCVSSAQNRGAVGYTPADLALVGDADLGVGCGTPVRLARLQTGENVLDLGCGAGIDCLLAADAVGPAGRVVGVDMTPEMLARARAEALKSELAPPRLEFRLGEIENLPCENDWADAVISNCVVNLSPDKPRVLREALRVLKPGGAPRPSHRAPFPTSRGKSPTPEFASKTPSKTPPHLLSRPTTNPSSRRRPTRHIGRGERQGTKSSRLWTPEYPRGSSPHSSRTKIMAGLN